MNELIKNKKKSEVLAEKIKALNYGDVVTHKQISKWIDEKYPSNKYKTTIAKAKKILLKNGICLESIIGDGYRILEPDNFVDKSLKHYKRGLGEVQKGYDTLRYAPTENMTPNGKEIHRKVYDRSITLLAAMKGASVELKTLGEKKHPMSFENIKNN